MDTCGRTWRKQTKLEKQLSADGGKPKAMHWRTYERIRTAIEQCEGARDRALYDYCLRLKRHGRGG